MTDVYADHIKIPLSRAKEMNGILVSELTMREPTARDEVVAQKQMDDSAMAEITMFANLCDISPEDVLNLSSRDYRRLVKAYANFTEELEE